MPCVPARVHRVPLPTSEWMSSGTSGIGSTSNDSRQNVATMLTFDSRHQRGFSASVSPFF